MLTRSYLNVFVMHYTYKTNKYKMLLLDIIGVSSFNTSFYSCSAFLDKEGEEDYVWALQMFSKILGPIGHPSVIVSDRELALMNAIQVVFPTTKNLLFSSRAEGAHGKLKKYLQVSTGDLHRVKNKICLAIENEYKEIEAQLSSERIQTPHKCNTHFFKDFITNVSAFAMGELLKQ
ncbi:hypothetical protein ACSBR2_014411 [Camellia fascicularis]